MSINREEQLYVIGVRERRIRAGLRRLTFHTTCGDFDGIASIAKGVHKGVIMLGDRNGGFGGPNMIYPELAGRLQQQKIASLRLDYRIPTDCAKCAVDTLLALQYLDDEGVHDVILLGWSFGAVVALATASVARCVRGVVCLSPIELTGCRIRQLQCRPLLVAHGEADAVSPVDVSCRISRESHTAGDLIVYPGAGHDLAQAHDRLLEDLLSWIPQVLTAKRKAA